MKKTILSLIILFAFMSLNAQSFKEKLFMSRGWILNAYSTPSTLVSLYNTISTKATVYEATDYFQEFHHTGGGIGYSFAFRYNILEFDDEMALSAEIPIGIGLNLFNLNNNTELGPQGGIGMLNVPLMFQFNYGNGATYNSSANVGFVFGLGIEYNFNPLFVEDELEEGEFISYGGSTALEYKKMKRSWVQPVLQIGIRHWNRNNKLKEISIKYGFGSKESWETSASSATENHAPYTIQLTFMRIMNY